MIPPPNVTGSLHIGHALNSTLQDILVRWMRMSGRNTLWVPGTDHAGIATQNVVERQLAKEQVDRHALGREQFVEKVWEWKKEYGGRIINQLKRMGASCDWERERFTMDEGLSRAVREVFVTLYEEGLIYRGERLINWCPRCHTALSDIEVEHEDEKGKLYHLSYPLSHDHNIRLTVATTRPETMLGDTAVAVHPLDPAVQGPDRKDRRPAADDAGRSRSSATRSLSISSSGRARSRSRPPTISTITRQACGTSRTCRASRCSMTRRRSSPISRTCFPTC